jgi:virulence factor Mce-like protein
MRRIVTALVLLGVGVFAAFALGASNGPSDPRYWVELDNAFGLIKGGDFKVAGVRAGKITNLKLDPKTLRALVQVQISQNGFGSLRTDVHCESRPQSLIGEYFLDCAPGTAPARLKPDSVIPVTHTASTIGPDLVNDILRDPYRERLRIILDELGAGVAGNAKELNATIRRAVPALRETDQVLGILSQQDRILANLATEGNQVISALANNNRDVQRFVVEANNAASNSAQRKPDIAAGIRKLPDFLAQLQPALAALGQVADAQTPALRNLNASADQLKTFFGQLGPLANVSTPAFNAFGKAAQTGDQAVVAARPSVAQLNQFTTAGCPLPPNTPSGTPVCGVPELSRNLAIVLQHLDNRQYAVEPDPRSPGGQGYTGLEALLQYFFTQTSSINTFDSNVHVFKTSLFVSDCSPYADAQAAKDAIAGKNNLKHCFSALGPTQPGINAPDPTATATPSAKAKQPANANAPTAGAPTPATPNAPAAPGTPPPGPGANLPNLQGVLGGLGNAVGNAVQDLSKGQAPSVSGTLNSAGAGVTTPAPAPPQKSDSRSQQQLLNYLLAP